MEATELVETLGVAADGRSGNVRPTRERLAKLRGSLRRIIAGRPISGRDMERVLGHLTFSLLLCRPLLSVLSCVYVFIVQSYDVGVPGLSSVRSGLGLVLELLV